MVFNGYSLTGFSITIYNNIIIINTKILTYNKVEKFTVLLCGRVTKVHLKLK